ncbi:hypothetical protein D0Z07_5064 [Hyphodiscus hymeniophilus]|uniref:Heterokaryon incompatibility domain-containing protein n=1 Tax=Hyphodiscus hymeniophilus TaxID=353542 RepID=A0A9P6VJ17_9HELO|nr:hypothetical protein D0Z07_5064 [Hyphodiscus hymeniophilus]
MGTKIARLSRTGSPGKLITKAEVEPALATKWLSLCQEYHGDTCAALPSRRPDRQETPLRLIDVQQLCIVEAAGPCEYFALSYVWGDTPQQPLLQNNVEVLQQWGALIDCWHRIPQTIRDAVQLTQRMNARYLWVDSLCLVQDDESDMRSGIMSMDSIYELATLTLVAANAADATAGLPGVRKQSRVVRQMVAHINEEVSFLVIHELEAVLKNTAYNGRGWTSTACHRGNSFSRMILCISNVDILHGVKRQMMMNGLGKRTCAPNPFLLVPLYQT